MIRAGLRAFLLTLTVCATSAGIALAQPATSDRPVDTQGFAPLNETVFASILALVPPGPGRAPRALAVTDRQLAFQQKIWLHPEFTPEVRKVLDKLPPRQATIIRAASLYSRPDIPWNHLPDKTHQISVAGRPDKGDYLYALTSRYSSPETPMHMAGAFTLQPSSDSVDGEIRGVDGRVGADILLDTYGAAGGIDFLAALLRFVRGDLKPPWDKAPGGFNHHDRAALDRFHAEMPNFSEHLEHYLKFDNVLDEFAGNGDPVVLFNLNARVQVESLKPFPELYNFYRSIGPAVVAKNRIVDANGNRWLETRFNRGRIRMICMVRRGMLTPFTADYRPAGPSFDLGHAERGTYRTESSATITRLGMTFGLGDLRFVTDFRRDGDSVHTTTTMENVPALVAPPGIHKIIDLIAGNFLRVLAQGDGGFKASFSSSRVGEGLFRYEGDAAAEFSYAPALEFLARIGDSVADQHSAEVKKEERELGQELFDAFMTDYNDARPRILALDQSRKGRSSENAKDHRR